MGQSPPDHSPNPVPASCPASAPEEIALGGLGWTGEKGKKDAQKRWVSEVIFKDPPEIPFNTSILKISRGYSSVGGYLLPRKVIS